MNVQNEEIRNTTPTFMNQLGMIRDIMWIKEENVRSVTIRYPIIKGRKHAKILKWLGVKETEKNKKFLKLLGFFEIQKEEVETTIEDEKIILYVVDEFNKDHKTLFVRFKNENEYKKISDDHDKNVITKDKIDDKNPYFVSLPLSHLLNVDWV